jgi:transcriptional regulator with XRE-family HTH domain
MLGERIRALRTERGMSVRQFATEVGVSPATISQVERDITDPSLETLRRIARALDVAIFDLFAEKSRLTVAVARASDDVHVTSGSGAYYRRASPLHGPLEVLDGQLPPGAATSPERWSHPADECVVVIRGRLVVEVGDERVELTEDDSCSFDSNVPHRYLNEGSEPVRFIVAVTPPSY